MSMYCTINDLNQVMTTEELIRLSNDEDDANNINSETTNIKIREASSIIDSYITVTDKLSDCVKYICGTITKHLLYQRKGVLNDVLRYEYEKVITMLKDISTNQIDKKGDVGCKQENNLAYHTDINRKINLEGY